MRLRDLYKREIFGEKRGSTFSPLALIIVTMTFAVATSSFDRYQTFRMLPLAAFPIFMGAVSRIQARDLFKKILAVSPFVIFVGIWNPFFDTISTEFLGIAISRGWVSFFSLIIKFTLIASSTLTIVAAAGFDGLCRSAAAVGLPDVLVTQIFLLQRYIRLISEETHNVVRARVFRGGKITLANAGNVCGPLLLRSVNRSARIHNALMCRGFEGRLYQGHDGINRILSGDLLFILFWILFFCTVRIFDISTIIGDLIVRCVI